MSPPARATSLLTAEATPACSTGAEDSAVAVSGATVMARPSAEDEHARAGPRSGSCPRGRRGGSSTMPAPTTTGPTAICRRGPMRAARAPERAEKASMMAVRGRSELPASSGE